jgi:hypothetical protein
MAQETITLARLPHPTRFGIQIKKPRRKGCNRGFQVEKMLAGASDEILSRIVLQPCEIKGATEADAQEHPSWKKIASLVIVEIDNRGHRLRGCLTCNIWWSLRGGGAVKLSVEDLEALQKLRRTK